MDAEFLKTYGPWASAVVALFVGILNFVGNRLNKTDDPQETRAIYREVIDWTSTLLMLVGAALGAFAHLFLTACALFFISFGMQTYLFLDKKHDVSRAEVVVYSLQTAMVFSILILSVMFKSVSLHSRMIEAQFKMLETLSEKNKSSTEAKPSMPTGRPEQSLPAQ